MAAYVQDVFMLFGDSITQGGWEPDLNGLGQRLSHVYARKLDILNRGFSGYNTDWALPVFEQCLARREDNTAPRIRVLAIWFGANDACILPSPQHVPRERFKANLKKMVQLVKSPDSPYHSPGTSIILITPPPVNTHQRSSDLQSRNPPLDLDRLFEITESYAGAVREVGAENGVAVVDVWTALWNTAERNETSLSRYLEDGLHLNAAGYEIAYNQLITTIVERHPEVHYDNLHPVFPWWKDINWDNPQESLYIQKK